MTRKKFKKAQQYASRVVGQVYMTSGKGNKLAEAKGGNGGFRQESLNPPKYAKVVCLADGSWYTYEQFIMERRKFFEAYAESESGDAAVCFDWPWQEAAEECVVTQCIKKPNH